MKPRSPFQLVRKGSRNLAIALITLCAAHAAQAATIYWDGTGNDWATNTFWSTVVGVDTPDPAAIPGAADIATFSASTASIAQTVYLNGAQSVAGLSFLGTPTITTTLLGGTTASTLTLGSSGITIAAGAGAVTLGDGTAANDVLISLASGNQTWTNNSSNAFALNNTAASFTRAAGATLAFNAATAGFSMSTTVLPNDATGIIGAWASFGTGSSTKYAYNNAGTIAGLTGTAAATGANLTDTTGTVNYDLNAGGGTVPAIVSANTIRYTSGGNTTAPGATSFTVNGLMNVGSGVWTIGTNPLTIGGNKELVINTANNGITISSPIRNNGGGASSLTKTGGNTLILSGLNTYTGGVALNAGQITLSSSTALGTGTLTLAGGTTLDSGAANLYLPANNPLTINGDFTFTGTQSLNLGTGAISLGTLPGTTRTITANTSVLTLSGVIADGTTVNALTKAGNGTLVLNGNNTYTGATAVTGGTLILGGTSASTGATTVTGGTLIARNAAALGSSGGNNVAVTAGRNLTYYPTTNTALAIGGTLSLPGTSVLGSSIGSTLTGAAINVAGAATTSGTVTVNVFGIGGVTTGTAGTYTLATAASGLDGATYALGKVYNNTNFTVGTPTATATDLTVAVTNATALTTAFWRGNLSGATNVWSASNGSTQSNFVSSLALANQPLVPGSGTDVIFNTAARTGGAQIATLGADTSVRGITHTDTGAVTLAQDGYALTLGAGGIWMQQNNSNNTSTAAFTINTPVILGAAQTWKNDNLTAGQALNIGGNISNGSNDLIVRGISSVNLTGSFLGSGAGTLSKYGGNTLTLSGANTNTGVTSIYQGNITLSGDVGTLKTSTGLTLNGGTLLMTNGSAQGAVDRLGNSAGITSYGGGLQYNNTSSAGVLYAETVGSVALTNGQLDTLLNTTMAGAGTPTNAQTLTLSGLTHTGAGNASTVTFSAQTTAPNATTNMIKVTGASATTAGQIIGAWATTGTAANALTDYAVYDGSTNIVPAAIATSAETTWTTAANAYTIGAGQTLTATRAITALRANTGNMTVTQNQFNLETFGLLQGAANIFTINATSGVLRQQGTSAANMYLTTGSGNGITINANIQDNTGALTLVKSGSTGNLILNGLNTFTGGVVVNAGTVQMGATSSLFTTALGTGTVVMSGGALDSNTAGMVNLNNNALTVNGDFTFTGTQSLNFGTGAVSLGTTPGISRTLTVNTNKLALGGVISDGTSVNSLTKAGNNSLVLSAANVYTGETVLSAGLLQMGTNPVGTFPSITSSAIGTGTLVFNAGGISSDSITARSVWNPVTFTGHGIIGDVTALGKLTFSSAVDLGQAVRTISTPGGDVQFDAALSGLAGGITKSGIGTLILNAANTYGDQTNVSLGTLKLGASGTLPTGTNVVVASGTANQWAVLDLNGQSATIGTLVLGGRALSVNNATQAANATGSAMVTTGAGTLTLGGDLTYDNASNPFASIVAGKLDLGAANRNFAIGNSGNFPANPDLIVSAVISAPGSQTLTLNGTGQVLFSGNNTYAGTTALTAAGTLFITGSNTTTGATAIGGSGILIARSANALGGSGNTAGVTVANAAANNLTYNAAGNAPLVIGGNLSFAGSGILGATIGSDLTTSAINVAGNATTAAAVITVNLFGNSLSRTEGGSGDYTLIAGGGSSTLNNANYTLGTIYNNTNFTVGALTKSATDVKATVTIATPLSTAYWKGTGTTNNTVWAASSNGANPSNWASDLAGTTISSVVPGSGADVIFSATGVTSPAASTLGSDMTIKSLTYQSTAGMNINADGYTLTITPDVATKGIKLLAQGTVNFNAGLAAGAAQTWSNYSGQTFTVNGNVALGTNALTVTGANTETIVGAISGGTGGSITKNGTNILNLSGNNTFSAGITVNQGTLQLGNPTALGTGTLTFSGAGAILDSSFGSLINTNANAVALNADFTFTGSQALNLGTGAITLGAATSATSTTRTLTVNGNVLTLGGVISDGGTTTGLAKAGNNVLLLNGANLYTGLTTITNNILKIGQSNAIKSGNAVTLLGVGGAPTFDLNGFNQNIGSLVMGSYINNGVSTLTNTNVASLSTLTLSGGASAFAFVAPASAVNPGTATISVNTVDLNGGATFNVYDGASSPDLNITSVVQNGTLTKTNSGQMALQGVNIYTGVTSVYGGQLQVSGNLGTINQSTGINLGSGASLLLTNVANQTGIDRIKDSAGIASYGGSIQFNNTSSQGVVYAETVGALALNNGQFDTILNNDQNGGAGTSGPTNSQTLTLSGLTQAGASTVTFSAPTTQPNATTNIIRNSAFGAATTVGQILAPWATTGINSGDQRDYAVYDASGNILPANITGTTADTTWTAATDAYTAGTGGGFNFSLTANRTIAALRGNGNSDTLNLNQFNLETSGILHGGQNTWTINATSGVIRQPGTAAANLYVTAGRQRLDINAPIVDNTGALTLVKSGTQSLYLRGVNSFSGGLVLNAGTTFIDKASALGTGTLTFAGGTIDNENVQLPGISNGVTLNGYLGYGATGNYNLVMNGAVSLGTTPGAWRTINVANSGSLVFNGVVSNGTSVNSIEKTGAGYLVLKNQNTYSGNTLLTQGEVQIGAGNVGTVGSITSSPIGTGGIVFNGGGLASNSITPRTILNPVSFSGSQGNISAYIGDAANQGLLTFSAGIDLGFAPRQISTPSNVQFDGIVGGTGGTAGGGLIKNGVGVLTLTNATNSYQGTTAVAGGVLRPTVVGAIPANSNLIVSNAIGLGSNATLDLATHSIDLTVGTLTMSGNIIANNGLNSSGAGTSVINTGSATLTLGGDLTYANTANPTYTSVINGNLALGTLNLVVNNPVLNSIGATPYFARNMVIADSSGAAPDLNITAPISGTGVGINKSGPGMLLLSANNTFTGGMVVSAGSLFITGSNASTFPITQSGGTIVARSANALGGSGNTAGMTVATNLTTNYNALSDAQLAIGGNLTITGGASTYIGASIGATAGVGTSSAQINIAGVATITNAAHKINIFGINGVTPASGTNAYTLIHGGAGSSLNPVTAPAINFVYNNTNFTLGATATFTRSATDLQLNITDAAPISTAYWRGGLTNATQVWAASTGIAGSTGSNWSLTSGGSGSTAQVLIPGALADVLFYSPVSGTGDSASPNPTTLGTDMSIKSLTVNDFANSALLLNNDGYGLTIGTGGISVLGTQQNQAVTINPNLKLSGAQTWTLNAPNYNTGNPPNQNLSNSILNVQGNIDNGGNLLTVNAAAGQYVTLYGVISGAGGLTKMGGQNLYLAGANSYAGDTTLNYGTIILQGAGGPGASPLGTVAGGTYVNSNNAALDLNGTTIYTAEPLFLNGNNGNGALTNSSGTVASWTGPITLQSNSSIGGNVLVNGAGAFTGGGFNLTLTGGGALGNFGRVIDTGVASLTKSGTGTWMLSGANTYTGSTLVSNGILKLGNASAIPSANPFAVVAVQGVATFDLGGFNQSLSNLTMSSLYSNGASNITSSLGNSTLTLTGGASAFAYVYPYNGNLPPSTASFSNVTVDMNGGATFSVVDSNSNPDVNFAYTSVLQNGALTKTNGGQMALQAANTYTGATNIYGGQLQLSGNFGSINPSTSITISGGASLLLTNTSSQNLGTRVGSAAGIASYGGNLQFNNTTSASMVYTQTTGALALESGQFDTILNNDQNQAGNSQTLTLSGLTHSGSSVVTFSAPSSTLNWTNGRTGLNTTTNIIKVTGASGPDSGQNLPGGVILGPWATVGFGQGAQYDYAAYDATGNVVSANITASAETTWTNAANAYTTGTTPGGGSGSATLTGNRTMMALRDVGSNDTLTMNQYNLETAGLLNHSNGNWQINSTTGVIRQNTTSAANLYVTTSDLGSIFINAPIANNTGALTLVKSGYQSLYLRGANTYTGGNVLNAGTLIVSAAGASSLGSGTLTFAGGSLDNDNVQLPALTNSLVINGNMTYGGTGNYGLSFIFSPVSLGTAPGTFRTISVGGSAQLSFGGVISNSITANSIEKTGSGNLRLAAQNLYTGDTILSGGAVQMAVNSVGAVGSITSGAIGTGRIVFNGGGLVTDTTARTVINPVVFSGTASGSNVSANLGAGVGGGKLTFSAPIDFGFASRYININGEVQFDSLLSGTGVGAGTGANGGTVSGGGLIKGGAGTLTLTNAANTYNGSTAIVGGILRPTAVGAIPAGTNLTVASNISLNTATLDLATNNINLAIGTLNMGGTLVLGNNGLNATTGWSLINSGAATLTLGGTVTFDSNAAAYTATIAGNLALGTANLTQYNTGINQYTGVPSYAVRDFNVNDSTNAGPDMNISAVITGSAGLAKNSGGTLLLSGNNSYSGPTIVTAGTLILNGTKSTTGVTMVNTGGTLMARSANALGGSGNTAGVTVYPNTNNNATSAASPNFTYNPVTDAALVIGGDLTFIGAINNNNATLGAAIGSTGSSAQISVAGKAILANRPQTINIFGVPGAAPATGAFTLISGGAGSSLNPTTAPTLGMVYNNTNFTVGAFTRSDTELQIAVTGQTALTTAYWRGGLGGVSPQNQTWAVSNGSTASNWSATAPSGAAQALIPGIGTDVYIGAGPAGNDAWTSYLGADMSIKSLTINTTNATNSLTLNNDGYSLTLGSGGLNLLSAPDQQTIALYPDIKLAAAQAWTVNSPFVSPPNYGRNYLTINGNVDNQGNLLTINALGAQNTPTINGAISGAGGLTKNGGYQMYLSGPNTYTGPTTINGGSIYISSQSGSIAGSSSIAINQGSLQLVSGNANESYVNRVGDSTPITTLGGQLYVNNATTANANYAETIGAVTTNMGQFDMVLQSSASAANNTQILTFGGLTHNGTSVITFAAPTTQPNDSTNVIKNTAFGSATPVGQIIGAWATTGVDNSNQQDYATYDASGRILPANIAKASETTWTNASNAYTMGSGTFNINGNETLTANRSIAALRDVGRDDTLTMGAFNLETNGLLNYAGNWWNLTSTGGVIRQVGTAPANLYVTTGNQGQVNISAPIVDNTGALTLVKSGYQNLYLRGTNTYSGGTVINAGYIFINNASALGTGSLTFNGGSIDAEASLILPNPSVTVNADFTFNGSQNLNMGTGAVSLGTTPGTNRTIYVNNNTLTLGGVIGNGTTANSITKANGGKLVLTGTNAYTGSTSITGGTLQVTNASGLGTGAGNNVTMAQNTALNYYAAADAALAIGGNLAITSGGTTTLGTSIGSTTTSAQINVGGNATTTAGNVIVNIFGVGGTTPGAGTYTLVHAAGGSSSLNTATYSLGFVYNNTNFTAAAPTATATDLTTVVSAATELTTAFWQGGLSGAAQVWAASNGTTTSNWVATSGGASQSLVPGPNTDVTFYNSSVYADAWNSTLGADMSIKSLTFNQPSQGNNPIYLLADGSTLTIGSGGITDLASNGQDLHFFPNIALAAPQTWTNTNTSNRQLMIYGSVTNGGNLLTIAGDRDTQILGAITGTGGIKMDAISTLTLQGGNTFSGGVSLNAGTINVNNASALGATAGTLTLAGGNLNTGVADLTNANNNPITINADFTFHGSNNLNLGTGAVSLGTTVATTRTITTNGGNTRTLTIGGVISDGSGGANAITKSGDGNLALTGANTYTGPTTITNGALLIRAANNLGDASQVTNSISMGANSTLRSTANSYDLGANRTLTLTGAATLQSDAGTLTVSGAVANGGSTLTVTGAGNTSVSSVIDGGGGLTKTGLGSLTLSNANTYTGATSVTGGALIVNGSTHASSALTVTNTNDNTTVVLGGSGAINGSVTLSATAATNRVNEITGGTVGTIGTLAIGGGLSFGTGAIAYFDITNSSSMDYLNVTGDLSAASGTLLRVPASLAPNVYPLIGYTGTASSLSNFTLQDLTAAPSQEGYTLNYSGGALNLQVAAIRTWNGGSGVDNNWTSNNWNGATLVGTELLHFDGSVRLTPNNDFSAGTSFSGLSFDAGASAFTVGGNAITLDGNITNNSSNNQSLTLAAIALARTPAINTGANNVSISSDVSGAYGLTKSGSGKLTLSGNNSQTGVTTLSAGTLSVSTIGDGGVASSNLGSATSAAANLVFDGGGLQYTGTTASTDRNLTINAGKTATLDITSGGTNLTVSGAVPATTGGLTKAGAGTLTLTGANAYTGATAVTGGVLSVGNGGTGASISGTSGVALSNSANLTFNDADAVNFAKAITGSGSFTKDGPGTLTVNATHSYDGATVVKGGTLKLSGVAPAAPYAWNFESGTLAGWSVVTAGDLYPTNEPVSHSRLGHEGTYWIDTFESTAGGSDGHTGTIQSDTFILGTNAQVSFMSGGGGFTWSGTPDAPGTVAGIALERLVGGVWQNLFWQSGTMNNMPTTNWDASAYAGETVRWRVYDNQTGGWGWASFDNGYVSSAIVGALVPAVNLLPTATPLAVASGGVLDLAGGTQQVASLSDHNGGGGSVTNSGATDSVLTLDGGTGAFSGIISDGGTNTIALTKSGSGTQTLSGANTYTGATSVSGTGTLLIDGDQHLATGAVTVAAGATLGGTGIIGGTVNVSGVLAPGASIGTLTSGALTLASGSTYAYQVNSSTVGADLTIVSGGLTLDTATSPVTLNLTDLGSGTFAGSTALSMFNYSGAWSGLFTYNSTVLADDSTFSFLGKVWTIDYNATVAGSNATGTSGSYVNITSAAGGGGTPQIAVTESGNSVADGGSKDYPADVVVGANSSLTFTITNAGNADLNLTGSPLVTVTGTNAADFTVTAQPTTPVTMSGGTTTFTVKFAPSSTGARTAIVHIANNTADGMYDITLNGNGTTSYEQWATVKGLLGADRAFDADPDKDGIKNGLEWVLGGNPKANDSPTILPTVTGNVATGLTLVFGRNTTSIPETDLAVEWDTTLASTFAHSVAVLSADSSPGLGVTVDVDYPVAGKVKVNIPNSNAAAGKLFGRMKVTQKTVVVP